MTEEQQLRDDAYGFEDLGKDPENLDKVSTQFLEVYGNATFIKVLCPLTVSLKIRYQNGAMTTLPNRQYMPNFHDFSRSRVRAYTLVIKKMIYNDDSV